ncbi:hypothetical protein PMI22_00483 [Pseudomonas sp. GM21]|uniref:hypothetical protein n=1 Tax=Pseudomonas sp. GM21 TaxID=1144325 RepID=UPI0002722EBB|nr:hypothetical protein [Pseudomonas sp. GM21]EJM25137.1 hypothetical protein PMI22_00483 [Pseudomonas sp. GM21]
MKKNLVIALCDIALKPGTSTATKLIAKRRICRAVAHQLDFIRAERRVMHREAGKLKAFLPFTRQAIADLEKKALEHREDERSAARRVLADLGQTLMYDRGRLADSLGFDLMCDLLSVNPVHRKQAHTNGDTSLRGVVYQYRLEDSSTEYGGEWGQGGPFYRACHAAIIRITKECPENLPDLFEPGEVFDPKMPPAPWLVGE